MAIVGGEKGRKGTAEGAGPRAPSVVAERKKDGSSISRHLRHFLYLKQLSSTLRQGNRNRTGTKDGL